MAITVFECEQNSDEWRTARLGLVTASEMSTVLAKGKDGGKSLTRKTYMHKLAGERLTGLPMDSYSNGHMERGKAQEDEARELYEFLHDEPLQRVGFVRNCEAGCSPDSLVGHNGGLEIKTRLAHLQIELLLKDEVPPEHKAQIQGGMLVCERGFWDIAIYSPKLPLFEKRLARDEPYLKILSDEIDRFNSELHDLVEKIRKLQ